MYELVLIRCRLAIQIGVGFFRDGRVRHRTVWLPDVRPDAGVDEIAAVVRAVAPLLEGPVTRVRLVRKYALVSKAAENPLSSQPVSFLPYEEGDWQGYYEAGQINYLYTRDELNQGHRPNVDPGGYKGRVHCNGDTRGCEGLALFVSLNIQEHSLDGHGLLNVVFRLSLRDCHQLVLLDVGGKRRPRGLHPQRLSQSRR